MITGINSWHGVGRLTKDVEMKRLRKDNTEAFVVNNTLALNEQIHLKDGTSKEKTVFVPFHAWNGLAKVLNAWCKKGHEVYLEGALESRTWTDKHGQKRYELELRVTKVRLGAAAAKKKATSEVTEVTKESMIVKKPSGWKVETIKQNKVEETVELVKDMASKVRADAMPEYVEFEQDCEAQEEAQEEDSMLG